MSTSTKANPRSRAVASLPLQPLWDEAASQADLPINPSAAANVGFTLVQFSDAIGFSTKAISRWREVDAIPWTSADVAATKLGLNPFVLWGDEWLQVGGDLDDLVAGRLDAEIDADIEAGLAFAAMQARLATEVTDAIAAEGMAD